MPAQQLRAHLAHVDGLRACAALYVAADHARLMVLPLGATAAPTAAALSGWLIWGHYAVAVFIVISGFCLGLPVVAGKPFSGGRFLRARARRILPPYYIAMVLSLVLIWTVIGRDTGTNWDGAVPVDHRGYLGNLFLFQDVYGRRQINGPFWSIATEWRIYLVFPLIVLAWRRFGTARTAMTVGWLSILAVLVTSAFPRVGALYLRGATVQFLLLFMLGGVAAQIAAGNTARTDALLRRTPWGLVSAAAAAGVVASSAALGVVRADPAQPYIEILVGISAAALILAASKPGRARQVLGARPFARIGIFAYSIYLIHMPLLQLEWQYVIHPLHLSGAGALVAIELIGLPVVVAVAYGFFVFFERPFMSTRQKRAVREASLPTIAEPETTAAPSPASA